MILKRVESIPKQTVTMPGAEHAQMQMLCGPDDGCPNFAMRKFTVAHRRPYAEASARLRA